MNQRGFERCETLRPAVSTWFTVMQEYVNSQKRLVPRMPPLKEDGDREAVERSSPSLPQHAPALHGSAASGHVGQAHDEPTPHVGAGFIIKILASRVAVGVP